MAGEFLAQNVSAQIVVEARQITKSFPGVDALVDFDFDIRSGEIHGLLGENGAGKSTFIKLLNGLYHPDGGEFVLDGLRFAKLDPIVSRSHGIRFVHQDLTLFPHLSVTENIYMNAFPRGRFGTVDWRRAETMARGLLEQYGLHFDPHTRLSSLSIGQMQLVEIISNVSRRARVIVLDEPTASLGDEEKSRLFETMKALSRDGVAIIFISHILEEVLVLCDRITVLRDGRKTGTFVNRGLTKEFLVEQIVGEQSSTTARSDKYERTAHRPSQRGPALEIHHIRFGRFHKDISLEIHHGEIVGVLGLLGSGKTELANICFGLLQPEAGDIAIGGRVLKKLNPMTAIRNGVGYVTEDRFRSGIFPFLSVNDNSTISILSRLKRFLSVVDRSAEHKVVDELLASLNVKASSPRQLVGKLSGGNQQKVILGRWLVAEQAILIFDEPTKGVDVGARNEFYRILNKLKREGKAILVLTSDHREALEISDRLFLLGRGELKEFKLDSNATPKSLLAALAGRGVSDS